MPIPETSWTQNVCVCVRTETVQARRNVRRSRPRRRCQPGAGNSAGRGGTAGNERLVAEGAANEDDDTRRCPGHRGRRDLEIHGRQIDPSRREPAARRAAGTAVQGDRQRLNVEPAERIGMRRLGIFLRRRRQGPASEATSEEDGAARAFRNPSPLDARAPQRPTTQATSVRERGRIERRGPVERGLCADSGRADEPRHHRQQCKDGHAGAFEQAPCRRRLRPRLQTLRDCQRLACAVWGGHAAKLIPTILNPQRHSSSKLVAFTCE